MTKKTSIILNILVFTFIIIYMVISDIDSIKQSPLPALLAWIIMFITIFGLSFIHPVCPNCKHINMLRTKFCGSCGTSMKNNKEQHEIEEKENS